MTYFSSKQSSYQSTLVNLKYRPWIYAYYLLLLIIVACRTSEDAPNIVIRIGFLIAFFVPIVFKFRNLFPACLISFMTVGTYGFAYNFFPYDMVMYVIIAALGLMFTVGVKPFIPGKIFIFILIYVLVVDLANSQVVTTFSFSLATTMLMVLYMSKDKEFNARLLLNCFCVSSLTLALIYLLNYEKFLFQYNHDGGELERSGWTDANYLSCIIGMGVITALYLLLSTHNSKLWQKVFWISTLAIAFVSQVIMASRGGLLSVAASSVILIFMTHAKIRYKVLATLAIAAFVIWLFQNDYFELMIYRIEHDDGTGSGRSEIWEDKLESFWLLNPIQLLFGVGYEKGNAMGGGGPLGFHNDFVAILCEYGFIGLILFLYILIRPLIGVRREERFPLIAFLVYIVATCMTLEPFTAGRLTYFGFYLMIAVLANANLKKPSRLL